MILGEPIILGGGGGIPVVIIVETEPGANVLCINGTTVLSKTANADGKAVFEVKKEGFWTIQAFLDGEISETKVFVEHKIEEELAFVDPILSNNTWEKISAVARAGKASQFWNVGDTKPITVAGSTYNAQIMDFDMYDVSDPVSYGREKAGIVFQFVECIPETKTFNEAQSYVQNTVNLNLECKDLVPIINYPALASYNANSATIYQGKGINPTGTEIFTKTTYEKIAVGTQYAFYAAGNSKVKHTVSSSLAVNWWTRSRGNSSDRNVYVHTSGTASNGTSSYYCAPVFCL